MALRANGQSLRFASLPISQHIPTHQRSYHTPICLRKSSRPCTSRRSFHSSTYHANQAASAQPGAASSSPRVSRATAVQDNLEKFMTKDLGFLLHEATAPELVFKIEWKKDIPNMLRHPITATRFFISKFWIRKKGTFSRLYTQWQLVGGKNRLDRFKNAFFSPEVWRHKRNRGLTTRSMRLFAGESYQRMYTAFMQGQIDNLSQYAGEGLVKSLKGRITKRERNTVMDWKVQKWYKSWTWTGPYPGRPWLRRYMGPGWTILPKMEHRTSTHQINLVPGTAVTIYQIVFRVKSKQMLRTGKGEKATDSLEEKPTNIEWNKEVVKDIDEYVVFQLQFLNGVTNGPWFIWGFLDDKHIMTFDKFLTKRMALLEHATEWKKKKKHPSHQTVNDIQQGRADVV